ncbi:MAG: agmatine deiminase family protein [Prevotella sp.]
MNKASLKKTIYRLPAEWEPQDAIQLTWPHAKTDWADCLPDITATFVQLTAAMARYQRVVIAAQEPEAVMSLLRQRLQGKELERVDCYSCRNNDTWARDHGPITLTSADAAPLLLDFRFNGWGGKFPAELDNAVTRSLHAQHAFSGLLEDHDDFVLEGGSVESDGKGTILTTSLCLLAPHRNQPLTRDEIGRELCCMLRAERVLWLDHGQLIGDDTDGHIDTIARFAPHDTIVYVGCDDTSDPQYADLKAMEAQLRDFRTTGGQPYRLLPLPMPRACCYGGERLPATYANFVVLNGAVIVPTYGQPDNDSQAMQTIAEAFPGRDIVGMDALTVIRQHGSLHCLTMQLPDGAVPADSVARSAG